MISLILLTNTASLSNPIIIGARVCEATLNHPRNPSFKYMQRLPARIRSHTPVTALVIFLNAIMWVYLRISEANNQRGRRPG